MPGPKRCAAVPGICCSCAFSHALRIATCTVVYECKSCSSDGGTVCINTQQLCYKHCYSDLHIHWAITLLHIAATCWLHCLKSVPRQPSHDSVSYSMSLICNIAFQSEPDLKYSFSICRDYESMMRGRWTANHINALVSISQCHCYLHEH